MDKKTIYGLVLIGLILSVCTIVNQPSAEQLAKMKSEKAKIEKLRKWSNIFEKVQ